MIVSDISSLRLVIVLDRGVPNKECIALQANETLNVGQFGLMVGYQHQPKLAYPIRDNLFWFGDGIVNKGDWIFVYTGAGQPTQTKSSDGMSNVYMVHWGRATTIFANSNIVPILFRVDAVDIGSVPHDLPQLG